MRPHPVRMGRRRAFRGARRGCLRSLLTVALPFAAILAVAFLGIVP